MDWLIVALIAIAGLVVLIVALRAGRSQQKNSRLSEADRYLQQLTARSHSARVSQPQNYPPAQNPARPQQPQNYAQPPQNYANPAQNYAQQPQFPLPQQIVVQAQALVRSGRKIEAIKLIRQSTGLNLATAKQIVDGL